MLDRIYYVLQHKHTKELIRQQGRAGELLDRPALYVSDKRARQARTTRQWDIDYPDDWEPVPVRLVVVEKPE